MYFIITKRKGRSGKRSSLMGAVCLMTNRKPLVKEHLAMTSFGYSDVMTLTEKEARELHENLGRKIALADELVKRGVKQI